MKNTVVVNSHKMTAVRFALAEVGRDSSKEAAQEIIDRFEQRHTVVYLIDELIAEIRANANRDPPGM